MFQILYSQIQRLLRTTVGKVLAAVVGLVILWQVLSSPVIAGPLGNLLLGGVVPLSGQVLSPMQIWQAELVLLLVGGIIILGVSRQRRLQRQPIRTAKTIKVPAIKMVKPVRHVLRRPSTTAVDYAILQELTVRGDALGVRIAAAGSRSRFLLKRAVVFTVYAVVDSSVWAGIYLSLAVQKTLRSIKRFICWLQPYLRQFDNWLERRSRTFLMWTSRQLRRSEHLQVLSDIVKDISGSLPSSRSHK